MFSFISISAKRYTKSDVIDEDCHYAIYFIEICLQFSSCLTMQLCIILAFTQNKWCYNVIKMRRNFDNIDFLQVY